MIAQKGFESYREITCVKMTDDKEAAKWLQEDQMVQRDYTIFKQNKELAKFKEIVGINGICAKGLGSFWISN